MLFALVAIGLYSWVAAGLRPFTLAEEVMVAIAAIIVLAAAWRPSRNAAANGVRSSRGSAALWISLVVVAFAWELRAFFSSPRADHPTLSTIADNVMGVHPGRAFVFVLWLALGWLLVTTPRVERP